MFDDLLKAIFNKTVNENSSIILKMKVKVRVTTRVIMRLIMSGNESDNKKVEYYYEMRQLNNWFETIERIIKRKR